MFICKLFHLFPRANPHKLQTIYYFTPYVPIGFPSYFLCIATFFNVCFIYIRAEKWRYIFVHENITLLCPSLFHSSHKIKVMLTVASSNIFVMFSWETRHWSCPPLSLGPDLISDYNTSVHGHTADTRAGNGGPRSFHSQRKPSHLLMPV